jgi:Domain of unknown function (DUF4407)
MVRRLREFLYGVAGARPEILEQCPTERLKFESLGWAILITSGLATISMWFALTSAMGFNPIVSVVPALVWGVVIMGIDRWLVTSMPPDGSRRFAIAAPRIVLAVLLGTLISTPFVLRIFQSEINAQITVIKQQRASAFLAQQAHSQVAAQVTYWRNDVANLEKVIDSGGVVPLNPAADPEVQSLTKQRTAEVALEQKYYHQWQCQLYGGPGCPAGNGPLAQASEASYHQAAAQVQTLTTEIQARESQLSATDTASKQARLQQATSSLPAAERQLAAAQARETTLQANFDAKNEATNGLLIRLQALSQLSNNDFTVSAARFLLFLLFLVIECLPVTVKLLQRPGNYEKILQVAAAREFADAKNRYRVRPRFSTMPIPDADGSTTSGGRTSDQDVDLHKIWQPTKVMPEHAETVAEAPKFDRRLVPGLDPSLDEADSGEHAPLIDRALREMRDNRAAAGEPDRRGGGIPLSYHDDEL